ncbi:hypothetical protein KKF84_06010 [Myxococcota bacterium]|nr:hypothetical protein [Myxococcota bacterium]
MGKELKADRAEIVERSFAHCYESGNLGRLNIRGRDSNEKRVQMQTAAFNIGLVMKKK